MELLGSPASPFVRKVIVTLHETGQTEDVTLITLATSPIAPDTKATSAHATGKIPALLRPDGCTLYDSRVITQFLNARAKANLYPASHLWETLTLEATGDGLLDAAVLMVYEGRCRTEDKQDADWVNAQWNKVENALDTLENRWMSHLAGPLDAGQIAVGCALGYLDFRHDARGWRAGRPLLAAWYTSFCERPSMRATLPA